LVTSSIKTRKLMIERLLNVQLYLSWISTQLKFGIENTCPSINGLATNSKTDSERESENW
jgi:hypothetical protein